MPTAEVRFMACIARSMAPLRHRTAHARLLLLLGLAAPACGEPEQEPRRLPVAPQPPFTPLPPFTPQPNVTPEPPIAVRDAFRLADLPKDSFSTLTFGRRLTIPRETFRLISIERSPGHFTQVAEIRAVLIYDGSFLQEVSVKECSRRTSDCYRDLETMDTVTEEERIKISDAAECYGYWTPVRPDGQEAPRGAYMSIDESTSLPLRSNTNVGSGWPGLMAMAHSDNHIGADHLSIMCDGVPEGEITFGQLKALFNAPSATLHVPRHR
ncbi:hypothetical protein WMF04_00660 [Sorangium sp. So ce260]|uniref:hypothetical protein n=1 Tax=Sorangium sp. So ce260 TaxID=3133291 RepID=UPI003F5DC012